MGGTKKNNAQVKPTQVKPNAMRYAKWSCTRGLDGAVGCY